MSCVGNSVAEVRTSPNLPDRLTFALLACLVPVCAAAQPLVAYIQQEQRYIGTEVSAKSVAVQGLGDSRIAPRWSGNGELVLFGQSHEHQGRVTKVVLDLVGVDGRVHKSMEVGYGDEPKMRLAGVRSVKQIGWLDNKRIYVVGNVNPRFDEMRVFSVETGQELTGYLGTSFAVCTFATRVAYTAAQGRSGASQVFINEDTVTTVDGSQDGAVLRLLIWDANCSRLLAVRTREASNELVAVESGGLRSLVTLEEGAYVRAEREGSTLRLLQVDGHETFVDLNRPQVLARPAAAVSRAFAERRSLESSLGNTSFDIKP